LRHLNVFIAEEKKEDRDWGKGTDWPNGAQALSRRLNEQADGLRAMGVEYEHDPDPSTRTIYLWWKNAYPDGGPNFKNRQAMIKAFTEVRSRTEMLLGGECTNEAVGKEQEVAKSRARGSITTPM
jgi:hypothetical protein